MWLFILAALGGFASFVRRQRVGMFLTIMAVLAALIFRFAPQARLWNARVLPFWFLCLYLLAGVAFSETGSILVEAVAAGEWSSAARWSLLAVPVVTGLGRPGLGRVSPAHPPLRPHQPGHQPVHLARHQERGPLLRP